MSVPRSPETSPPSQASALPEGGESPLETLVEGVRTTWAEAGVFTPATLEKCGQTITRFARRLQAQGVRFPAEITAAHCQGFVDATTLKGQPPELTTRHARRSALRMLFATWREQGHQVGDPTLDLQLPPRTTQAARPLTDLEVSLCRAASRMGEAGGRSLHRAVCWALGETTAVTSEISAIRIGDLDDPHAPRWVQLPGTRRHDPRLGELSDWGSTILRRHAQMLTQRRCTPAAPLVYGGTLPPGGAAAQSSVCNAIRAVLDLAGLSAEPDVRPASLRNWAGRRLYDGGLPIDQVARRLGARTLDAAAADIALTWRAA